MIRIKVEIGYDDAMADKGILLFARQEFAEDEALSSLTLRRQVKAAVTDALWQIEESRDYARLLEAALGKDPGAIPG